MHRHSLTVATAIPFVLAIAAASAHAAIKKIPYPEVKVKVAEYRGDDALAAMRASLSDAVSKKDSAALFRLVGPTFVWTMGNALVEEYDLGRDALHNFKVVFGFRQDGKEEDGGVDGGPYWGLLAAFADDPTAYEDSANKVCTPTTASVVDQKVFELASSKIVTDDDVADWYFTLRETPVAKTPGDNGPPIGKLGTVAFPVLSTYPASPDAGSPVAPTHLEVLMPNGRTGWIPASAARSYSAERLCFAKTATGEWKIAVYDQPDDGDSEEQ